MSLYLCGSTLMLFKFSLEQAYNNIKVVSSNLGWISFAEIALSKNLHYLLISLLLLSVIRTLEINASSCINNY